MALGCDTPWIKISVRVATQNPLTTKREGDPGGGALAARVADPRFLHVSGSRAALTACDRPVEAGEVKVRERA